MKKKRVYYIEQAKILARAGVRYNWDFPFIFWHFLGRIVSEAFLEREDQLFLVSASVDGDREYVGFATRFYVDNEAALPKTLEVSLGWEDGHDPLVERIRAFWTPARPNIVANIRLSALLDSSSLFILCKVFISSSSPCSWVHFAVWLSLTRRLLLAATERQTEAAQFAEVTQAVLRGIPAEEGGKEGEAMNEDIYDDDASGEAVIDLQGPIETPRRRVLVVSERRMYYSVYFSPFESRFIPLEQPLPTRVESELQSIS